MRKEEHSIPRRQRFWPLTFSCVLVSAYILGLGGTSWEVPSALAKFKGKAAVGQKVVPTKKGKAPKVKPAPEPTPEERLHLALELSQQQKWPQAVQAIGKLDAAAKVTPTLGRLWFLRATLGQQLQDPDTAVRAYLQVWQTYPPLADYAAWEVAQYYAHRNLLQDLHETVKTLEERYPFSRLIPNGQVLLARTQHRLAQTSHAQATLERLLHKSTDHPIRPEALALLSQLYEDQGALLRAAQTLWHLGDSYPRHALAARALHRSRKLLEHVPPAQRPPPDLGELLASIDRLVEAQLWDEVDERFATLGEVQEPPALVIKVMLKRAAVAIRRQRLPEASALLHEIQQRYPKGTHLTEVQYLLTVVCSRQGQRASMDRPYEAILTHRMLLPWHTQTFGTVLANAAGGAQEAGRTEEFQQRLVRDVLQVYDQSQQGLWQAGWQQYRQGHYGTAERLWSDFELRFPRAALLPQILYWQARAAQQGGRPETAVRLYQRVLSHHGNTYYSRLAAAHVQQMQERFQEAGTPVGLPEAAPPPTIPWGPPPLPRTLEASTGQLSKERFHFVRVQELQQLQMHPLAAQEIQTLAPLLPNTMPMKYFLATLFNGSREHATSLRLVSSVMETLSPAEVRGSPRTFWVMLYPQAFWPEVVQQGKSLRVNPYVLLSIMRQESTFEPTAVSPAGARGLMQLMPGTAQEVATRLRIPPPTAEQLLEPQLSITLGTRYFAGLLERYQGNLVLALAAYNAGPGRVQRWLEQWAHLPMEEFVEHIPFDETRAYVKVVLRNLTLYERLYATS